MIRTRPRNSFYYKAARRATGIPPPPPTHTPPSSTRRTYYSMVRLLDFLKSRCDAFFARDSSPLQVLCGELRSQLSTQYDERAEIEETRKEKRCRPCLKSHFTSYKDDLGSSPRVTGLKLNVAGPNDASRRRRRHRKYPSGEKRRAGKIPASALEPRGGYNCGFEKSHIAERISAWPIRLSAAADL